MGRLEEFRSRRESANARILEAGNLSINRFFALDGRVYEDGRLDGPVKEMLGLVASLVLRCDDCIAYHLIRCREARIPEEELHEVFAVGLVVGGSIVIPHLRRAQELLEELRAADGQEEPR